MDSRGRCTATFSLNIFGEWAVKYHYLNFHSFENCLELKNGLKSWFGYYNRERVHQLLNRMTPDEFYFNEQLKQAA
jgi:putative transposase